MARPRLRVWCTILPYLRAGGVWADTFVCVPLTALCNVRLYICSVGATRVCVLRGKYDWVGAPG